MCMSVCVFVFIFVCFGVMCAPEETGCSRGDSTGEIRGKKMRWPFFNVEALQKSQNRQGVFRSCPGRNN